MQTMNETPAPQPHSTRLWIGIAIIVFGILAALDNLPFVRDHEHFFLNLWPVILIIVGIGKLSRGSAEKGISGYLFILAGGFILIHNFGSDSLANAMGPLFIVAVGVFLVTKALRKNRGVPPDLAAHDSFISSTAIFGGNKRRVTHQDFKGGELTAIFGGFELDLRQATVEGNQVRVDVFVLFGGGEIKIPQHWAVSMKGTAMLGGFEDKTLHMPSAEGDAPRVHLVVTGLVLFGGLTVMN
ncbi:LiaI-LiaF-like domain-containing protein [Geothrix sp. 21YS21S-2]|uniref:LiaF transmembrane domain-containing protein n=1 Tax=Geothrix sp. 21YS21S-2 TaxID=3068893 RepID=UPI0027BA300F|nr:LiaF domain-containing protein [Geothrix sp. 21YS21S-2]